jgi:hypothetical protein
MITTPIFGNYIHTNTHVATQIIIIRTKRLDECLDEWTTAPKQNFKLKFNKLD